MNDEIIICRCEDITLRELRELIKAGYTSLEELKGVSRLGMGPCRGNTCLELAAREIARYTGQDLAEIKLPTSRPPLAGVKLGELAGVRDEK